MRMEIRTLECRITVSANETTDSLAEVDRMIEALRIGRRWLAKQKASKPQAKDGK